MYYLCVKNYKPITVQYYIADCISLVPRLTLLDIWTHWTYKYTLGMELVCMWGLYSRHLRQEGVAYSTIQQEEESSDDSPANQTVAANQWEVSILWTASFLQLTLSWLHCPQPASFPYKNKLIFLVLWIYLWSTIVYTSQIVFLWLFPNKLALADKITGSPVTKVDRNLNLLLGSYCSGSEESAVLPRVMDRFLIMCSLMYTPRKEERSPDEANPESWTLPGS